MAKKLITAHRDQTSAGSRRSHKSSTSEKTKKEVETAAASSKAAKDEQLISFDLDENEDENNITLTNIIENIVSPNKKSNSSSSNTSPQLAVFSASNGTAALNQLTLPMVTLPVDEETRQSQSESQVLKETRTPLDSAITFTFSDDEIDDNSNASSHNMQNLITLNAPLNTKSSSSSSSSPQPPEDQDTSSNNLIPFSSLNEQSQMPRARLPPPPPPLYSPTPLSAGFTPSNLNPLRFAQSMQITEKKDLTEDAWLSPGPNIESDVRMEEEGEVEQSNVEELSPEPQLEPALPLSSALLNHEPVIDEEEEEAIEIDDKTIECQSWHVPNESDKVEPEDERKPELETQSGPSLDQETKEEEPKDETKKQEEEEEKEEEETKKEEPSQLEETPTTKEESKETPNPVAITSQESTNADTKVFLSVSYFLKCVYNELSFKLNREAEEREEGELKEEDVNDPHHQPQPPPPPRQTQAPAPKPRAKKREDESDDEFKEELIQYLKPTVKVETPKMKSHITITRIPKTEPFLSKIEPSLPKESNLAKEKNLVKEPNLTKVDPVHVARAKQSSEDEESKKFQKLGLLSASPLTFPSVLSNSLQMTALSEQIHDEGKMQVTNGGLHGPGSSTAIGDQIQYSADGRPMLIVNIELDLIKIFNLNQFGQPPVIVPTSTQQFHDSAQLPLSAVLPFALPPRPSTMSDESQSSDKYKKSSKGSKVSLAPPPPPPPLPPPPPTPILLSPKPVKAKEAEEKKFKQIRNEVKAKPRVELVASPLPPPPSQAQKRAGDEAEPTVIKKPKISENAKPAAPPLAPERLKTKTPNGSLHSSLLLGSKSKSFSAVPSSGDVPKKATAKSGSFELDFLTS